MTIKIYGLSSLMTLLLVLIYSSEFEKEIYLILHQKLMINSEMKSIFEKLNEAIITKTNENIAFCNNIGINILNEIYDYEGNLNFKGVLGNGK